MRRQAGIACLILLAFAGEAARAEEEIRVTRLTDRIYQLSTDQGSYTTNTLASVGADGVLLVDTQAEQDAEALAEAVATFDRGAPRIIINTHRHVEHVGGNAFFGEEPLVIAHDLVRGKLRSGSYLFDEFPDATLPDISFSDRLTLQFNGEEILLLALPGSHDDNEIIVHFTQSKVVHLSSLVNGFNFPSVDSDGDVLAFERLVGRAMELLPKDVVIVSGHNRNGSWSELGAYREMLLKTTEVVRKGLEEGRSVADLQRAEVLRDWETYAGSYVSTDQWIEYLAEGLQGRERKPTIFEPLYRALQEGGVEAALARYRQIREVEADEYQLNETDLLVIGSKLLKKGRVDTALRFLQLGLEENPESSFAFYANYQSALAHDKLGNRSEALAYCRKARELAPDNPAIAALLEKLEQPRD